MRTFTFATDETLNAYFGRVIDVMTADFAISEEEAVGRIDRAFVGADVLGDETLTREWARDLAYQIYYPGQMYWKPDVVLIPAPYP